QNRKQVGEGRLPTNSDFECRSRRLRRRSGLCGVGLERRDGPKMKSPLESRSRRSECLRMDDTECFRLLGKYRTPRFRYGRKVFCGVRGKMVITGMTDAPIRWPVGKGGRGRHSLVVYKGLAKAVRRESNQAVAFWWGIRQSVVSVLKA